MIQSTISNQQYSHPDYIEVKTDAYDAYHLSIVKPVQLSEFAKYIRQFCDHQINKNKVANDTLTKAIWVKLQVPNLHFVSQLCDIGFDIHCGLNKTITLHRWIALRDNLIPPFSVFYVACGALLIKDNCVFLVQEKSGSRKGKYGLPGGRADPGETISRCAQRQLFEQTKIKAKFKYIIQFRQMSQGIYNCMDLYFACFMQLDQKSLQQFKICQIELSDYKWVPLADYYDFTLKNSSKTQNMLAEYITKLWKSGYDFDSTKPYSNRFYVQNMGEGKQDRISAYHELVPLINSSKSTQDAQLLQTKDGKQFDNKCANYGLDFECS